MISFEHTEVIGWEHAIRGMRNPMNSWHLIDTDWFDMCDDEADDKEWLDTSGESVLILGDKDLDLMKRLRNAGTDHRKFMRMIVVYVDITAPLYWWKEFDTYKVGTVANSCSTMHKIADKEFTLEDFSCEHLFNSIGNGMYKEQLLSTIGCLNHARKIYLETKDKKYWWQMIQLLPTSYNQKRTVMMNYEVLNNVYKSRKGHKLDEWSVGFMKWIESLPYAKELIIGGD